MSNHIFSQYFSFSSIRRQQQSSSVDDDNEMAEMNRSLFELSLDRYPTENANAKVHAREAAPVAIKTRDLAMVAAAISQNAQIRWKK